MPEKVTFFPNQKRKITLVDVTPKLNTENEKRIMISFEMPLSGQPITGMAGPIAAAYSTVGKLDDCIPKAPITMEIEGMTIESFPHDGKDADREMLISAATLRKLLVSRPDGNNADDISLTFNTTVPWNKKLWTWAGDNLGATFFAKFDATQATLVFQEGPAESKQDGLFTSTEDAEKMMAADKGKPDYKPQVEQTPERAKAVNETTKDDADKMRKSWQANKGKGRQR